MDRLETGLRRTELYAIGVIVHHWAYLEHAVERLIWAVLNVPSSIGRGITADLQFPARMKMLQKLVAAKHTPMVEIVEDMAKSLKDVETERNLIVHGLWRRTEDSPDALALSFRRKSSSPEMTYGERFPSERLDDINKNIIQAVRYVNSLVGVVRAHAPSPDK